MTREEAINDIRDNILPLVGGKSLKMAIEALSQRWIPCAERLPIGAETIVLVNVSRPDKIYPIILCRGKDAIMMAEHGDINAWMPLPEPWKGETE